MAQIAGITIERNAYGKARYIRIDLKRYANQLSDFIMTNNIKIDDDIKWTKKMKQSLGEKAYQQGDINNFWNV
jgi:hypothetical protein